MLTALVALQLVSLAVRGVQLGPEGYGVVALTMLLSIAARVLVSVPPESFVDAARTWARRLEGSTPATCGVLLVASIAVLTTNVFVQQLDAYDERGILGAIPLLESGTFFEGLTRAYRENAWLGPQHPPGTPLFYHLMWRLGLDGPYALRLVSVGFGVGGLLVVWRIAERLYGRRVGLLASLLLLTTPLFVRIDSAIGNDPAAIFFFWLAVLSGLRLLDRPSTRRAAELGVVLALGVMAKYTFVVVGPVLLALPWATRRSWPPLRAVVIALLLPAVVSAAWAYGLHEIGRLEAQQELVTHFSGTVAEKGQWGLISVFVRLPAALGIYSVPVIALGLTRLRVRTSRADAFLLLWGALVFAPIAATMPVNRFFLPAFPAATAVMALGLLRSGDAQLAVRAPLLMAALCAITLLYYGYVDLAIHVADF